MSQDSLPSRQKKWLRWSIRVVVLTFAVLSGAAVYQFFAPSSKLVTKPLPVPNGYDDLIAAAEMIVGNAPDLSTAGAGQLRTFVDANQKVLARAREGLGHKSCVPVVASLQYMNVAINQNESLRELGFLFAADAKLAERNGQMELAAEKYLDAIRLGESMGHGGLIVDHLNGMPFKQMGQIGIRTIADELPNQLLREIIHELEFMETEQETLADVRARDNAFEDAVFGWHNRILGNLEWNVLHGTRELLQQTFHRETARSRLLRGHLAVRSYKLDKGRMPEDLNQLVPEYVSTVPIDPFSGESLCYRTQPDGYVLYSVGADGQDDGGSRASAEVEPQSTGADLFLDPEPPAAENEKSG